MKPVYFLLPFLKPIFVYRNNIYNNLDILVEIKNISIFEEFNSLPLSVQQFMLSF
jgi:hypothetical protein